MDTGMLHAAEEALLIILDPHRLGYLFAGVVMGLGLGILPGIGGLAGLAMLLPFTYDMETHSAFALLLGMGAATTTADPIGAILFGVPGHAASAATTLDGYPLTRQGQAGRALGASYISALLGGLFGAALLGLSLPVLRPLMLYIGPPELLSLAVFGISMVAVLSGKAPLRGLTAGCFGIMLAMIGSDPQSGTLRWTLGSLYLWDGLPLVPVTLGVFALPELCDLMIAKSGVVASGVRLDVTSGMLQGVRDCLANWFLILRCSWIGAAMGSIPGIGVSVIDWISYGHALRTEKGAADTFGKGDVRGVIAAESATNAKEGGALVPTLAFGVPTSAGAALLLGAFLIHGLVPGPDMLSRNLDITYSMVWSIAIANILGCGLCFLFSGWLARLCTLRYTLILPVVLSLIYIGAFEGTQQWGDFYSLLFFGAIGWLMKQCEWPRPPLVLGFILGRVLEKNLFLSIQIYGLQWLTHPVVVVMFALAALSLARPLLQDVRGRGGPVGMLRHFGRPHFDPRALFPAALLCLFAAMLIAAAGWTIETKIIPFIVGGGAVLFGAATLLNQLFAAAETDEIAGLGERTKAEIERRAGGAARRRIHMDIASSVAHLPDRVRLLRGGMFFAWLGGFLALMGLIGLIPTVPLFIMAFMRIEGRERWRVVMPMTLAMTVLIYVVFDQLLAIPWPQTVAGDLVPALKAIPGV